MTEKPTVSQIAWAIKKANDRVKQIEPKYHRVLGQLEYYMSQFKKFYPEEFNSMQKQERDQAILVEKINSDREAVLQAKEKAKNEVPISDIK